MKNNRVTIDLDRRVPDTTAAIIARIPALTVRRRRPTSALHVNGKSWPLVVVSGGLRPYAHATADLLASLAGERLGVVVAERLGATVRKELEDAGCAYIDGTGYVHIDVPGLLLHIEAPPNRIQATGTSPTGLGVVGVRVVQAMLGEPLRDWSVADLARAAASSTGEVHRVLTRLEADRMVIVSGRGPARRRHIANPHDLLDWLALVPSARRLRERLPAYIYAPDVDRVVTRLAAVAMDAGMQYAVTGAAGASVLGVHVATAVPHIMVRVDPEVHLAAAADMLGAEAVEEGANVMLVRDLGKLGIHGSIRNGPVSLAPAVRIWLDMLGEPRGADAASLFREALLA